MSQHRRGKSTSVYLITYGEPGNLNTRDHYAYSLSILKRLTLKVAPIPRVLLPPLAFYRGWVRRRFWKSRRYLSNLESITERQALKLKAVLEKSDPETNYSVRALYEFRTPNLLEALSNAQNPSPDRIVIIPLYVVDSDFTSGISQSDVEALRSERGGLSVEPDWLTQAGEGNSLARLMTRYVEESLDSSGWDSKKLANAALVLGSHGTLIEGSPGIDTGLDGFLSLYRNLEKSLGGRFRKTTVGWLNHSLGGEWTKPSLNKAVAQIVHDGIKNIVYFPFGFLADSAETELESRVILESFSDLEFLHLACLNNWDPYLDHLAGRVLGS